MGNPSVTPRSIPACCPTNAVVSVFAVDAIVRFIDFVVRHVTCGRCCGRVGHVLVIGFKPIRTTRESDYYTMFMFAV